MKKWKGSYSEEKMKEILNELKNKTNQMFCKEVSEMMMTIINNEEEKANILKEASFGCDKDSILHLICEEGEGNWKKEIERVIERGWCDINRKNRFDEAPLCIAADNNNTDILMYFLNKGADVKKSLSDKMNELDLYSMTGYLE